MKTLKRLVAYKSIIPLRGSAWSMNDVTFKRSFGPWKEGEQVAMLCVDFNEGVIVEALNGKRCNFEFRELINEPDKEPSKEHQDDDTVHSRHTEETKIPVQELLCGTGNHDDKHDHQTDAENSKKAED